MGAPPTIAFRRSACVSVDDTETHVTSGEKSERRDVPGKTPERFGEIGRQIERLFAERSRRAFCEAARGGLVGPASAFAAVRSHHDFGGQRGFGHRRALRERGGGRSGRCRRIRCFGVDARDEWHALRPPTAESRGLRVRSRRQAVHGRPRRSSRAARRSRRCRYRSGRHNTDCRAGVRHPVPA